MAHIQRHGSKSGPALEGRNDEMPPETSHSRSEPSISSIRQPSPSSDQLTIRRTRSSRGDLSTICAIARKPSRRITSSMSVSEHPFGSPGAIATTLISSGAFRTTVKDRRDFQSISESVRTTVLMSNDADPPFFDKKSKSPLDTCTSIQPSFGAPRQKDMSVTGKFMTVFDKNIGGGINPLLRTVIFKEQPSTTNARQSPSTAIVVLVSHLRRYSRHSIPLSKT